MSKQMKITAHSKFHGNISQSFIVPLEVGRYPRRCRKACDGSCDCGYPCVMTVWDGVPDGYIVYAVWNDVYPRTNENIVIVVEPDCSMM